MTTAAGRFREARPVAYQEPDDPIDARFVVKRDGADWLVTFKLGAYDRARPLVIRSRRCVV